jgi:hypothetical protein
MIVYSYMALAAVLAFFAPTALIVTRNEIRTVRSRIVEELRATLFRQHRDLPQLALVAARYRDGPDAIGGDRDAIDQVSQRARQGRVKLFSGAAFYVLVCLGGFMILLLPKPMLLSAEPDMLRLTPALFWMTVEEDMDKLAQVVSVAGAAFLGGYVFQLRYLVRATLNQELSAVAFVRASLHGLQGVIVAVISFRALGVGVFDMGATSTFGFGASLGVAFLIGYWPDLGLMRIAKTLRVPTKRIDEDALSIARVVPLEIIDGIDTETSHRLQESNLYDVQNLASVNPIELYAETPFTLLEIFDWVLQAQLCVNVGTRAFGELRRHGVRTIFDLERAVLSQGAPPAYVTALGCVLFKYADADFRAKFCPGPDGAGAIDPSMVRHAVAVMCDDLHIHRLRSLWRIMLRSTSDSAEPSWLYDTGPLPGDLHHSPAPPPAEREAEDAGA